jgi:hypothetical protein
MINNEGWAVSTQARFWKQLFKPHTVAGVTRQIDKYDRLLNFSALRHRSSKSSYLRKEHFSRSYFPDNRNRFSSTPYDIWTAWSLTAE